MKFRPGIAGPFHVSDIHENAGSLNSEAIAVIARCLHAKEREITGIGAREKGMTNRSFLFPSGGEVRLIDWECAGMQDPHVGIIMLLMIVSFLKDAGKYLTEGSEDCKKRSDGI